MDTTRNRSMVLAQFLRGAIVDLATARRRVDPDAELLHDEAISRIEGVADELETVVAIGAPDPPAVLSIMRTEPTSQELYYKVRQERMLGIGESSP